MNGMVRTVMGEIPAEKMGNTSVHEHLTSAFSITPPEFIRDEQEFAIEQLHKAKESGLDTVIEVSACPRVKPDFIRYIAERSPVNIVACTGFYCAPWFTDEEKSYSIEQFLEHMLYEAEYGIEGSGLLPGVLKTGSFRPTIQPCEVRSLTAAGMAQKMTGLPLCVHSSTGSRYQQYLIEAAGADMEKVYFSHLESPTDRENRTLPMQIDYIENTMKRGSYVSINGFCYPPYLDPNEPAEMVRQICERGYAHKMLLSLDWGWEFKNGKRNFSYQDRENLEPEVKARNWAFLMSYVVPFLHGYGIAESDLNLMLRDNVYKLFG